MNENQRAAFLIAQSVVAQAEIAGMTAENMQRQAVGNSMAYGDDAFFAVIDKYGLSHNVAISFLRGD
jgi:hypothetical protein